MSFHEPVSSAPGCSAAGPAAQTRIPCTAPVETACESRIIFGVNGMKAGNSTARGSKMEAKLAPEIKTRRLDLEDIIQITPEIIRLAIASAERTGSAFPAGTAEEIAEMVREWHRVGVFTSAWSATLFIEDQLVKRELKGTKMAKKGTKKGGKGGKGC